MVGYRNDAMIQSYPAAMSFCCLALLVFGMGRNRFLSSIMVLYWSI